MNIEGVVIAAIQGHGSLRGKGATALQPSTFPLLTSILYSFCSKHSGSKEESTDNFNPEATKIITQAILQLLYQHMVRFLLGISSWSQVNTTISKHTSLRMDNLTVAASYYNSSLKVGVIYEYSEAFTKILVMRSL